MLYHYTSFEALKGILNRADTTQKMNFWATRYDFFEDKEEFKLGVVTLNKYLPKVEESLQEDRKIANYFKWDNIKDNINIPWPYVVSFTNRCDNSYMWLNYADRFNGVVLSVDDSVSVEVPNAPTMAMRKCIYLEDLTSNKLLDFVRNEYLNAAYRMLNSPSKGLAFNLMVQYPQIFVQFIAYYLLSFVAPQFKGRNYQKEEETRAILAIPIPEYINSLLSFPKYQEFAETFKPLIDKVKDFIPKENTRLDKNGDEVKYRDMELPVRLLKTVYVRKPNTREQVASFFNSKGLDIPIVMK